MNIKEIMEDIRRQQLNQINQQMPSITDMGKNLVQTAVDSVKSVIQGEGFSITEDQASVRLSICEGCEFYVNTRCTKCGCYMAVKTHLKAATCPVGKW
jgi:hypothetical protein